MLQRQPKGVLYSFLFFSFLFYSFLFFSFLFSTQHGMQHGSSLMQLGCKQSMALFAASVGHHVLC